ncbi:M48 family metalloprotease [Runella zeae]|uniref:M48 family metalloprotease n=1 Tax=Runella zeae TaxID=94255 RepID=UPI0004177227|nr:M48 family metalloprotease [Runella zeae]
MKISFFEKPYSLFLGGLFLTINGWCQNPDPLLLARIQEDCKCISISNSFGSSQEATKVVTELAQLVGEKIQNVIEVGCTANAKALMCDNNKYILYRNSFMKKMGKGSPWAERFIMAHEISHHFHQHTANKNYINDRRFPQILVEKINDREVFYTYRVKTLRGGMLDTIKVYKSKYVNLAAFYQYLKEFQADATATWMVYQKKITLDELNQIWKQYTNVTQKNPYAWTSQHPSIYTRQKQATMLWKSFKKGEALLPPSRGSIKESRKISTSLTHQFIASQAQNTFGDSLSPEEQHFWEYIKKTHKYTIQPTFTAFLYKFPGLNLPTPTLENAPNALPAQFTRLNYTAGIKITSLNWYRPIWFEGLIQYKSLDFSTYEIQENLKTAVEDFKWKGLQILPQVHFNTVAGRFNYDQLRRGAYATVGFAADIPFQMTYSNYLTNHLHQKLDSGISRSLVWGIGFIQLSRDPKIPNIRLGVSFQSQKIVTSSATIKVPQVGIHSSVSLW